MAGENLRKARDWLPQGAGAPDDQVRRAAAGKGRGPRRRARRTPAKLAELFERFELKALKRDFEGGGSSAEGRGKGEDRGDEPRAGAHEPPAAQPRAARRERASRAATKPYSPRSSSTRGSQSSRARSSPRSIPRPPASTRCRRGSWASRSRSSPARAAYIPVAHRYAGRARAAVRRARARAAEAVARGRAPRQGRAERQVRHARVRQSRHQARGRAARHAAAILPARKPPAARHGQPRRAASRR